MQIAAVVVAAVVAVAAPPLPVAVACGRLICDNVRNSATRRSSRKLDTRARKRGGSSGGGKKKKKVKNYP